MRLRCQDVLYVYSPGDKGEELPPGYGIAANEVRGRAGSVFIMEIKCLSKFSRPTLTATATSCY